MQECRNINLYVFLYMFGNVERKNLNMHAFSLAITILGICFGKLMKDTTKGIASRIFL